MQLQTERGQRIKTLYEQIKEALENGVTCVQLREKNLDEDSFIEEAKKISNCVNSIIFHLL